MSKLTVSGSVFFVNRVYVLKYIDYQDAVTNNVLPIFAVFNAMIEALMLRMCAMYLIEKRIMWEEAFIS